MQLVILKCPNCGAELQIEANRRECFCTYCGAKALLDDGSTRIIDEAEVLRAETEKIVQLKKLELEQERFRKEEERLQKKEALFKKINIFLFITFVAGLALILIGLLSLSLMLGAIGLTVSCISGTVLICMHVRE